MSPLARAAARWIVVGTDFSAAAGHAIGYALRTAATNGACVACVHAYEDPPGALAPEDRTMELRARLEHDVARWGAECGGVPVDLIVRRGAASEKLLNVAADLGADWIVVGASGARGSRNEGGLGSVAARLASTSSRVVVVVPPSERV